MKAEGSVQDNLWLHNEIKESWEHMRHCLKLTMNINLKQKIVNKRLECKLILDVS